MCFIRFLQQLYKPQCVSKKFKRLKATAVYLCQSVLQSFPKKAYPAIFSFLTSLFCMHVSSLLLIYISYNIFTSHNVILSILEKCSLGPYSCRSGSIFFSSLVLYLLALLLRGCYTTLSQSSCTACSLIFDWSL